MAKRYKITYDVVFYDRLKEIDFHGLSTYPIYIKAIFRRDSKNFKSSIFDSISKPWYKDQVKNPAKVLKSIIDIEARIMDYVISRLPEDADLDLLFKTYKFYSTDLCEITEEAFRVYLFIFLLERGMPSLSKTIVENKSLILFDNLMDMQTAFTPTLYNNIVDDSLTTLQPYLPVYKFTKKLKRPPFYQLTIFDWETGNTMEIFKEFLKANYPDYENLVLNGIERWLREVEMKTLK